MDIGQAIRGKLLATGAVSAIVAARIHPQIAPQWSALPYVVYQVPSRAKARTFGGPANLNSGEMRLDAYAEDYATAYLLARAVADALDGFSGTLGFGGGSLRVQGAFVDDSADDLDLPIHGDDQGIHSVSVTAGIHFNEAA